MLDFESENYTLKYDFVMRIILQDGSFYGLPCKLISFEYRNHFNF